MSRIFFYLPIPCVAVDQDRRMLTLYAISGIGIHLDNGAGRLSEQLINVCIIQWG
jgi:hypothetical protein